MCMCTGCVCVYVCVTMSLQVCVSLCVCTHTCACAGVSSCRFVRERQRHREISWGGGGGGGEHVLLCLQSESLSCLLTRHLLANCFWNIASLVSCSYSHRIQYALATLGTECTVLSSIQRQHTAVHDLLMTRYDTARRAQHNMGISDKLCKTNTFCHPQNK